MMSINDVTLKCKECGQKWETTKTEGGFWHHVKYIESRCPECGSNKKEEVVGSIIGGILDLLGLQ